MKHYIGLWIDHRRAVIVSFSSTGDDVNVITSGVEKHPSRDPAESEAFESQDAQADDVRERKFVQHLNPYYDEVIARVGDASSLLIMGPAQAKTELRHRLELKKPGTRKIHLAPAAKMSDAQVVAKVREYFRKTGLVTHPMPSMA